jgi:gliding motility-associated-like protein
MPKFLLVFTLFFALWVEPICAQEEFFITPGDTTVQCGTTIELFYSSSSGVIAENKVINAMGSLSLGDDVYSDVIPIGFDFEFFGNTYSEVVIGSNNYLTFNLASAGTGSGFQINAPIPNPAASSKPNSIMCPWQDINPNNGGSITWASAGEAPNRIFIVSYEEIPMFSCTDLSFTSQVYLYEGCNTIETHILEKPLCTTWNNGRAIHGLHNADGTHAVVVETEDDDGNVVVRNSPTQWTAFDEGYRFFPVTEGTLETYVYEEIPFCFVPLEGVAVGDVLEFCSVIEWEIDGASEGFGNPFTLTCFETTTVTATFSPSCALGEFDLPPLTVTITVPPVEATVDTVLCFGRAYENILGEFYNTTGNYSDTLQLGGECVQIENVNLFIEPIEIFPKDTTICLGQSISVGNNIYNQSGTYIDTLQITDDGCLGRFITNLLVTEPEVSFPEEIGYICKTLEEFYLAEPTLDKFTELLWNTGDTSETLLIVEPGNYSLTAFDEFGCEQQDEFLVLETCPAIVYIPNAFTPNNDGVNDTFKPIISGAIILNYQISIFDRWGNLVFSSNNPEESWNGENAPSGVYSGYIDFDYSLRGVLQNERKNFTLNLLK